MKSKYKYKQMRDGLERDAVVKDWFEKLPIDEKLIIRKAMRKLSKNLYGVDCIGMLWLIIALACIGVFETELFGGE